MAEPLICPPRDAYDPLILSVLGIMFLMGVANIIYLLPKPPPPPLRSPFEYLRDEFWLPNSPFRCPVINKRPKGRCKNCQGKANIRWLHRLRKIALDTPPDHSSLLPILRQYVYLHFCYTHCGEYYDESLVEQLKSHLIQRQRYTGLVAILSRLSPNNWSRDLLQDPFELQDETDEEDIEEESPENPDCLILTHPLFNMSDRKKASELSQATPARDSDAPFRAYKPRARDRLHVTAIRHNRAPIKAKSTELAEIYIYSASKNSSPAHSRYVKIGRSNEPSRRFNQWTRCFPNFVSVYEGRKTQWVEQIEALIQADLHEFRRFRERCWDEKCAKQHTEWFEYDLEMAKKVADYWVRWVDELKPYESDGTLKVQYVRELFNSVTPSETKTSATFVFDSQGKSWIDHSQLRNFRPTGSGERKKDVSSRGQQSLLCGDATEPRSSEFNPAAHHISVRRPNSSRSGHPTDVNSDRTAMTILERGSPRNPSSSPITNPMLAPGRLSIQSPPSLFVQTPQSSKSVPSRRSRASSNIPASKSDSHLAPFNEPGPVKGWRSVSDPVLGHGASKEVGRTSKQLEQLSRDDSANDLAHHYRDLIAPRPRGNKSGTYGVLQMEAPCSVDRDISEDEDGQSDPQMNIEQNEVVSEDGRDDSETAIGDDQQTQSGQDKSDNNTARPNALEISMDESYEYSEWDGFSQSPTKPPVIESIEIDNNETTLIGECLEQGKGVDLILKKDQETNEEENGDADEGDSTLVSDDQHDEETGPQRSPPSSPGLETTQISYPLLSELEGTETEAEQVVGSVKAGSRSRPGSRRTSNISTLSKNTSQPPITPAARCTTTADPKDSTDDPAQARPRTVSSSTKKANQKFNKALNLDGSSIMKFQVLLTPPPPSSSSPPPPPPPPAEEVEERPSTGKGSTSSVSARRSLRQQGLRPEVTPEDTPTRKSAKNHRRAIPNPQRPTLEGSLPATTESDSVVPSSTETPNSTAEFVVVADSPKNKKVATKRRAKSLPA